MVVIEHPFSEPCINNYDILHSLDPSGIWISMLRPQGPQGCPPIYYGPPWHPSLSWLSWHAVHPPSRRWRGLMALSASLLFLSAALVRLYLNLRVSLESPPVPHVRLQSNHLNNLKKHRHDNSLGFLLSRSHR